MATTAASPPAARATATGAYDRMFYSSMALAMALTVFVGFAPTYYLNVFSAQGSTATITGRPFTTVVHLHAVLFTGWVLLFIIQTALIAGRRVKVHQRMGIAGAILATAMVVAGVSTAIDGARAGSAPPGVDPLVFLAIPLADMAMFSVFVGAALWSRRDREAHKRLMLLAYVSILAAAVARWPGVLPLGPLGFYGLAFGFILLGILYDLGTRRRVHKVYLWGGALLVLSVPVRLAVSTTDLWRGFAQFLTR